MEPTQVLRYPDWEFDLPLCVTSGQVFRWRGQPEEHWVGVVGHTVFWVENHAHRKLIQSVPPQPDLRMFSRLFRLEEDVKQIQARLRRLEPRWEQFIRRLPGLRLMRWHSAEECLFSFLCTSANNIPRITGMIERLCATFGEPIVEWEGVIYRAFPTAERIARLQEADLLALGFGYRGRVLIGVAKTLRERGADWLNSLHSLPYEEAKRELMQLPGVGAKIADCVLLFGLDKAEAVPVDTHLRQAMDGFLPELRGKSLTERTYRRITDWFHEHFGNLSNWAHQYLFTAHLLGIINE